MLMLLPSPSLEGIHLPNARALPLASPGGAINSSNTPAITPRPSSTNTSRVEPPLTPLPPRHIPHRTRHLQGLQLSLPPPEASPHPLPAPHRRRLGGQPGPAALPQRSPGLAPVHPHARAAVLFGAQPLRNVHGECEELSPYFPRLGGGSSSSSCSSSVLSRRHAAVFFFPGGKKSSEAAAAAFGTLLPEAEAEAQRTREPPRNQGQSLHGPRRVALVHESNLKSEGEVVVLRWQGGRRYSLIMHDAMP